MLDQLEQKVREPKAGASIIRRRRLTAAIVAIAVLVAVGLGVFAAVASSGRDELAVASDLAEEWNAAWSGTDADAVADLFVDDGVFVSAPQWGLGSYEGREAIRAHAAIWVGLVTDSHSIGEVTEVGDGAYRVTSEFKVRSRAWRGEVEFEVEGDLLSRYEFLLVEALLP